ncbi:MAG: DNA-3-methyladenine glycosylase I [Bacteroidales bacterium]
MTYCEYLKSIDGEKLALHKEYHDNHYGFPIDDDNELFGRLILEINQAGLNWLLILKKQNDFRRAFENYDIVKVAAYGPEDVDRLLNDKGIIRNKLKIKAAIMNANIILDLKKEHGSFRNWLKKNSETCYDLEAWKKIFKKTFTFTGGEIVNEFLMSIGYLPGAHSADCPAYKKIMDLKKKQ